MSAVIPGAGHDAIRADHLHRVYAKRPKPWAKRQELVAVEDISLTVKRGTIFGMLGPNGAGKTTTIKMLSTLLIPTAGSARVAGFDVVRDDRQVRRHLGVVLGGDRGLYGKLTARDNLVYFANLYGMRRAEIPSAVRSKLEMVGLCERAGDRVEGFSRGMKQRLHLAKALIHDPPILILDEPTIGLDPVAAIDLRKAIADLAPAHTVLLTTHDMVEADALCEEIAIVDKGRIVAQGSPDHLKSAVAMLRRIVVAVSQTNGHHEAIDAQLADLSGVTSVVHQQSEAGSEWTLLCSDSTRALDEALAVMRGFTVPVRSVRVVEPTLEDAFLAVAGRSFE